MAKPARPISRGTLKKVLRAIAPHWPRLVLSLLLAVVTVALTLYVPVLTGDAIDLIVAQGQVDFAGVLSILGLIGLSIAVTALAQWVMGLCNNALTYRTVQDLRSAAFRRLQVLPLSWLDQRPTGEVVSRMVVVITPVSLLVAAFIARRTHKMFLLQSETRGEQTALIDEMVSGQKVVRAFGHEGEALAQFDEVNERLRRCSLQAIFFSSLTNPCTRFVNSLVYAGVGVAGALTALGGGLTVGGLSAFLSYANQYTKPFNEISGVVTELQNALACAQRFFELIEAPAQAPDDPDAAAPAPEDIAGAVTLEDVCFSYDPEQKLIEQFDLDVKPGQRIAIVGPTGCGKTTLINLLMRFYDVDAGAIRVDGRDVRRLTRKSLRRGFGMVLQDTWLRSGTIRENIAMGRPDAAEDEVVAAAKAAHAHGFIRRLPQGYDTVITEDGGSLSQGQKQLLCIARVMLCLPPMLILDEATSSIDTRTEVRIQQAFARLMEGRTSFIVAHRLSTIREADLILVMRDGKIVERGTHADLLSRGGFYAKLYNSQFAPS